MFKKLLLQAISILCLSSCDFLPLKPADTLFILMDNNTTGIDFINQLHDSDGTNVFNYRNYYNGGGVALGDVNNDGLNDIFLTSNQGDNELYLNKGNWEFENITHKAGVAGIKFWSTGVVMADINHDGWLDIYVCNGGNAQGSEAENELFINQQNGTFKEEAKKYGLADAGLTTHAVFFDHDLDGDLDCFVLNNSFRPIGTFDFSKNLRTIESVLGGSRLYRNDNGYFTDISKQAGIYSSDIGFGLGVSVADINQDGFPDIYVSNDFFEMDYLYINQKDGTYKEKIQEMTGHLSLASMGSDISDINNDGEYDIFTTEMLPETDKRLKQITSFESYDILKAKQRDGYFNQFMQNCLQLNNADGTFSEISLYAGVAATDWSWGALIFDMDNDGWKDIFVSNGIYKDLTNQDYIEFLANNENMQKMASGKKFDYHEFIDKMPSSPIANYAFFNNHDLTFTNKSKAFGLDKPSFSNGAAYGDLDNDGDNDLVINNVNMPAFIYKNNAEKSGNHYLRIKLEGGDLNKFGIGTTIKVFINNQRFTYYHQPSRGFQSSTTPSMLNIGLGKFAVADSLSVIWPNGKQQVLRNLTANQTFTLKFTAAENSFNFKKPAFKTLLKENSNLWFDAIPKHTEDRFIDFDQERLMFQMLSTENPYMASGDINKDGLKDFYFSNSKGSPATIYIQQKNGRFKPYIPDDFKKQIGLEKSAAIFGDFNGDGKEDLLSTYGGNQEKIGSPALYPQLFINDGKDNLILNPDQSIRISISASVIITSDYDQDGDLDLFIGGRNVPGLYGSSPASYVLQNDGKGNFKDVSKQVFGDDNKLGMVTAAKWTDLDRDGFEDLVIAGNWMGIKIFRNHQGNFTADKQLENYKGWWSSLEVADVNDDGKLDIIGGNLGLNSKFKASFNEPMKIYIKDFDQNGTKEGIISMYKSDHLPYVLHMRPDLVAQLPFIKKQFLSYEDYAGKTFDKVITADMTQDAEIREINFLPSAIFLNQANNKFTCITFPYPAQLSAVNTIIWDDIDEDGKGEIILAGNFHGFKPEIGVMDASYGQVFQYHNGFKYLPPLKSGLFIKGQVRSSLLIENQSGEKFYLFGRNDDQLTSFTPTLPD